MRTPLFDSIKKKKLILTKKLLSGNHDGTSEYYTFNNFYLICNIT